MRNGSPIARLLALTLVLTLLTGVWSPALAAQQGPSNADLETFRARLTALMQDLAADDAARTDAMMKVQGMPVSDLMILYNAYPKDGAFWEAPGKLKSFLKSQASVSAMKVAGPPSAAMVTAAGTVSYADAACPKGFNYEALWVARDAELVADIAMEVVPEDFTTSIAYVVAATAWAVIKATLFSVEQIYERWDDCETNKVFEKMDAPISTRASQTSVTEVKSAVGSAQTTVNSVLVGVEDIRTKLSSLGPVELSANVAELKAALENAAPRHLGPSDGARIYNVPVTSYIEFTADDPNTDDNVFPDATHPSEGVGNWGDSINVPKGTTVTLYGGHNYTGATVELQGAAASVGPGGINLGNLRHSFQGHGPKSIKVTRSVVMNYDVMPSQKSIDELATKVDRLSLGDNGGIATKIDAVSTSLSSVSSNVTTINNSVGGKLDASVSSRSSQTSVDSLASALSTVQTGVSAVQTGHSVLQSSVSTMSAGVGALGTEMTRLKEDVAALKTGVGAVDLSKLDAAVSSRASQFSIDALGPKLDAIGPKVDGLAPKVDALGPKVDALAPKVDAIGPQIAALGTNTASGLMALQSKVNALDTGKLDAAMSSRASQSSLDAGIASLLGAMNGQAALSVEVVEVQKRKRYLVHVTLAGAPVSGAALSRLRVLELTDSKPAVATDATATAAVVEIAPGILDVMLNVPGGKTDAVAVTVTRGAMTGSAILQSK